MQLSHKHIQSFIESWKQDFGEILAPEAARSEATRLLDFFEKFAEGLTRIRRRVQEPPAPPPTT